MPLPLSSLMNIQAAVSSETMAVSNIFVFFPDLPFAAMMDIAL